MIKIIEIESAEILYPIRHKVLWGHKEIENCGLAVDKIKTTFHIGAVMATDKIVGTSTFIKESNQEFKAKHQYRLRAMATDPDIRNQGIGKKIILKAMASLKEKQIELLWCDARVIACDFYEKLGFKIKGEIYEVPEIGPHKLMYIEI